MDPLKAHGNTSAADLQVLRFEKRNEKNQLHHERAKLAFITGAIKKRPKRFIALWMLTGSLRQESQNPIYYILLKILTGIPTVSRFLGFFLPFFLFNTRCVCLRVCEGTYYINLSWEYAPGISCSGL